MRKVYFLLFFIGVFTSGVCQKKSQEDRSNEIRLNLLNALVGSVDLQYERLLNHNSGLGLNFGIGYGYETPYNSIAKVNPVYRVYFDKRKAAGFFIEGNSRISYDKYEYYRYGNSTIRKEVNVGLGVGMGGKFVSSHGVVGTFMGGIGRFVTQRSGGQMKIYPLMEISLGKRF
jgi:hypothetical protein